MKKAIKIIVRDNTTNEEWAVMSKQAPRKTEPGVAIQLKINHKGLAWLKTNKGLDITCVKDINEMWNRISGMPMDCMGALASWKTPEEREQYSVELHTTEGVIDWKEAATTSKVEIEVDEDEPVINAQPVQMETAILTDTTPILNIDIINKVKEYLAKGTDENAILAGLNVKFNNEALAKQYLNASKEKPKPTQEIDTMFNF